MDPPLLLLRLVPPSLGRVYHVLPSRLQTAHLLPSSSSSPSPPPLATHASFLAFACFISDTGDCLVPSLPILRHLDSSNSPSPYHPPPRFWLDFPSYSPQPLLFQAQLAFIKPGCDFCILKPVTPFKEVVTYIEFCEDDCVEQGDPVFCFSFPNNPHADSHTVQPQLFVGKISLQLQDSYGMIVDYGHAVSSPGAVVTASNGKLLGIHAYNFTVQEGDTVHIPSLNAGKISIKDTEDGQCHELAGMKKKFFPGMSPAFLKRVQELLEATGPRRKQKSELSMVYPLSEARAILNFLQRDAYMTWTRRKLAMSLQEAKMRTLFLKRKRRRFCKRAQVCDEDDFDEHDSDEDK